MGFLINTDINPFIKKRPQLLVCEVPIKASDYVHCVEIHPFEDTELSNIRDSISSQTKTEIKKAVALSKTIEGCYKKII
jgi:hypothetical protein